MHRRLLLAAAALVAAAALGPRPPAGAQAQRPIPLGLQEPPSGPPTATLDLMTPDGVRQVQGEWRFTDVKLVESEGKNPDGSPGKTYSYTPHASQVAKADFDASGWSLVEPAALTKPRGKTQVAFGWYRIQVTVPEKVGNFATAGSTVVFQTTVDAYGEVWVDGRLDRRVGSGGKQVAAGFNVPNRVIVAKDVKPGQKITLAIFAINGPISATVGSWLFLRKPTALEFHPASVAPAAAP